MYSINRILAPSEKYGIISDFDDNLPLTPTTRQFQITTAGNLVVTRGDGTEVTLPVLAGQVLNIVAQKINTTTTAVGIVLF